MRRKLALPLLVAIAVVMIGAGGESEGTTPQEKAAREDAVRRLDAYEPPPRAREVAGLPDLDGPPTEPVTPNYLDVGRVWMTPESVARVRRWVETHEPSNLEYSGHGYYGNKTERTWFYTYAIPDLEDLAQERTLEVSVTSRGKGAALRADAQAVWIEPRPARSQIPLDVSFLEIERTHRGRNPERGSARGLQVQRLATLINGFGIVQPGTSSCTQPGPQAEIKLTFRRSRDAGALAVARYQWPQSNCDFLELRIAGKRQPGLEESRILHHRLRPTARLGPPVWAGGARERRTGEGAPAKPPSVRSRPRGDRCPSRPLWCPSRSGTPNARCC